MNNPTPYNSAYAVVSEAGALDILGRKQWVGIDGAPTSFVLSGHLPIESIRGSVGLVAIHDQFAIEKLTEVSAFYAKSVQLTEETFLAVSVNAGFRNYNALYSQLDAYDPKFSNDIRENTGTIGTSVMYYDPNRFYIGASLPRLSMRSLGKASTEDERYNRNTWYFSGAYIYEIDDDIKVKPAALLSYTRTIPALFDVSATLYLKDRLGLGVGYRNTNELAGILTYFFNNMNIGYSFQNTFGKYAIGGSSSGTHEITLGLRFGDLYRPRIL